LDNFQDIELNGYRYRVTKIDLPARGGAFILHQIATQRWNRDDDSFEIVQRWLLSGVSIYNKTTGILDGPIQFWNRSDGKEPQLTPFAAHLKGDTVALYKLAMASFGSNISPILADSTPITPSGGEVQTLPAA